MIDLDSVNNLNSSSARISIIRVASKYPSLQDEIMAGLLLISDMNELNKDYQTIFKDLNAEQLKEVNSLVDSVISIKNQIGKQEFVDYLATSKAHHKKRAKLLSQVEVNQDIVSEICKIEEILEGFDLKLPKIIKTLSKIDTLKSESQGIHNQINDELVKMNTTLAEVCPHLLRSVR